MTTDETIIRSVELLRPRPGDVVLLSVPERTTEEQRRLLGKAFQQACGPDVRIAVLRESMSVRVVRVADIPPEAIAGPGFEAQDAIGGSSVSSNFSSLP